MGNPHYFIAIRIPEDLQDFFASWQEVLMGKLSYKQWYHKKDLHITLKFLGAVEEETLTELIAKLKSIEKYPAFKISVGSLGIFGKPTNPRVLWAGVEKSTALIDIQREVEKLASEVGFTKENREYHPHITLAKKWAAKTPVTAEYIEVLKKEFTESTTLLVKELTIFQIHPQRQQKYEAIKQFSLL